MLTRAEETSITKEFRLIADLLKQGKVEKALHVAELNAEAGEKDLEIDQQ